MFLDKGDWIIAASDKNDPGRLVQQIVALLDVRPGHEPGHFSGARRTDGVGRVFGGEVVGQAIMAAGKTVADDRPIHSLHCYFMRPGSEDHEIDYAVDADMDGRSFSNRRVVARQQGKAIFNMTASFHLPESGLRHQAPMPDVAPPEDLRDFSEYLDRRPGRASPVVQRLMAKPSPLEYRPVMALEDAEVGKSEREMAYCWIKAGAGPLGLPQIQQRALLAWISDTLLLASAYRAHGIQIGTGGYKSASLDHAMWFHEDVECGEWLLYAVQSPWTGDGRGLATGRFFSRDGRMIASVAQEGLMRPSAA